MDPWSGAEEHSGGPVVLLDGLNPRQTEKADQGLALYSDAMAAEDDSLLVGVPVEFGEQAPET